MALAKADYANWYVIYVDEDMAVRKALRLRSSRSIDPWGQWGYGTLEIQSFLMSRVRSKRPALVRWLKATGKSV